MKAGKGKSKGSAFEREVSRSLTMWLTGQDKEYYFYRSPSSGAVATMNEMNGDISGDIIAVKPEARLLTSKYSIECKDGYSNADVMKVFKNNKNDTICDFWKQCIDDARTSNKKGMLIFRKKGNPIIVGIEETDIVSIKIREKVAKYLVVSYDNKLPNIVFFDYVTFLSNLNKEYLEE